MIARLRALIAAMFAPVPRRSGHDIAIAATARGKATISHTVHRACPRCQAPGVFSGQERIRVGWSGCYVAPGDPREGQPVGAWCPNCGAPRAPELTERRGVVWRGNI